MPSPFYNTEGPLGLRKLEGTSKVHDIGTGFQALGADVEEKILGAIVEHKASASIPVGQLALMSTVAEATATLPEPTQNALVGVYNVGSANVKVKVAKAGSSIYGDFITSAETITLTPGQHVLLKTTGSLAFHENIWLIVAGEPKQTQTYVEALTARASGTEYEPNATRPTLVTVQFKHMGLFGGEVFVGGTKIAQVAGGTVGGEEGIIPVTFFCGAGVKWKAVSGVAEIKSSYFTM